MKHLQNKFILITGAAGGIGSVVVKHIVSEGARVGLVDVSGEMLDKLPDKINELRGNSYPFVADITNPVEVENVFRKLSLNKLSVDVLINIAGIQAPIGEFSSNDINIWKKNIEVNLLGTMYFCYYAIQMMKEKGKGKIINFSGGGSTSPRPNLSAYAAAKTGVVRFTETIAEELREYNIDVNAISPGAINTRMLDEVLDTGKVAGKEFEDAQKRKLNGGDDPNLAAELICFLASDQSNGITGKLISAVWDPWKDEGFRDLLKKDKNIASLRRIDNKNFIGTH
jgi:NAD(P)-dependent dehydrogenase (short-subunit alcohol dehydrogenase family)